jgi:hypothetical protein
VRAFSELAQRPVPTDPSMLSPPSTLRQLTEIPTPCFTHCGSPRCPWRCAPIPCRAVLCSIPCAPTPPRRTVPGPRCIEVLLPLSFHTKTLWLLLTPVLPRRSTSARDIMRSGVARPASWSLLSLNVASICFKYFGCFRYMLQVFRMNVAKVY